MERANLSNKALARSVQREAERQGSPIRPDHVSVRRWLDGVRPQGQTPHYIASAIAARIGEPISVSDVGMAYAADAPATPFTAAGDSSAAARASLLLTGDLAGNVEVLDAPLNPHSWDGALIHWMLSSPTETKAGLEATARPVATSDVEELEATTDAFSRLDYRFGGGRARMALVQYLASNVKPRLAFVRATDPHGCEYLSAVASMMRLASWMAYDSGRHGLAQHYMGQTLELAAQAGDCMMGGYAHAGMSHQANYLGHFEKAENLARAAYRQNSGPLTPTAYALFYSMEARS